MFGGKELRKDLRLAQLRQEGFEQGLARTMAEPIGGMGYDAEEREVYRHAKERGEEAASKLVERARRRA
jgi:hypothetical protein